MKDCDKCFAKEILIHDYTEQEIEICAIANEGIKDYIYTPEWCPLRKEYYDETDMDKT